jgi:F0F1-type ATP synthase assembly protein I
MTNQKLTPGQSKTILALLDGPKNSWYELSRSSGVSIKGLKRNVIPSLIEKGILKQDGNSFSLKNKERIVIKKSYYVKTSSKTNAMKLLTELIGPCLLGMILSFIVSLIFGLNAVIFILGSFFVFCFQFFYSFYKVFRAEEVVEVYLKPTGLSTKPSKGA